MIKSEIRKEILKIRDNMSLEEQIAKSRLIFKKLIQTDEYNEATDILVYASFGSEVRTDDIILDCLAMGKKVYCPKVTDRKNGQMVFVRISSIDELKEGFAGIREPEISENSEIFRGDMHQDNDANCNSCQHNDDAESNKSEHHVLVLVPGVAFDHNLNRIGYNGGFYDRFLEKYKSVSTIGIAYEIQIVDYEIPSEFHDKKLQKIATENEVLSCL